MPTLEYHATAKGLTAQKVLSGTRSATVSGITSRGIFLTAEPREIIFLSFESYKGPLTLNLRGEVKALSRLRQGDRGEVYNGDIYFIDAGITIFSQRAEGWEPSLPTNSPLNPSERNWRIRAVASAMLAQRNLAGLGESLAGFLGIGVANRSSATLPDPSVDLRELQRLIHCPDPMKIRSALQPLLGLGAGLTPSGDDLIIGLLLAYHRWKDGTEPLFELSEVNEAITRLAFQRTTLISANLIACASLGGADERLIIALDGLMSGFPEPADCAQALLNWGSSSGCDALAGMALAIYQKPARL